MARRSSGKSGNRATQHWLAITIVTLSIVGISVAAALAIGYATKDARADTTRLVFTSVLPLFGTWVGTVLAFYFARENLQTTTDTLGLTRRLEPSTPVRQVMIGKAKIQSYDLTAGEGAGTVRLSVLYERMTRSGRQRIPILDATAAIIYIVHQSTIESYASTFPKDPGDAAQFTETVSDLLGNADYQAAIEAIGVVGPDAVLSEARTVMRSVPRCNDVFVTEHGRKADPVIGWLTNTDLAGLE